MNVVERQRYSWHGGDSLDQTPTEGSTSQVGEGGMTFPTGVVEYGLQSEMNSNRRPCMSPMSILQSSHSQEICPLLHGDGKIFRAMNSSSLLQIYRCPSQYISR